MKNRRGFLKDISKAAGVLVGASVVGNLPELPFTDNGILHATFEMGGKIISETGFNYEYTDGKIRMWAGNEFCKREIAPFRILQDYHINCKSIS